MVRAPNQHAPRPSKAGVFLHPHRAAFSLLELVIVLAVLAVASLIAVPSFVSAAAGRELNAAQQTLLADIQAAKLRARRTSTTHTIKFYPSSNRYIIAEGTDIEREDVILTRDLADTPFNLSLESTTLDGDVAIITPLGDVYPEFDVDLLNQGTTITVEIEGLPDQGAPVITLDVGDIATLKADTAAAASVIVGLGK